MATRCVDMSYRARADEEAHRWDEGAGSRRGCKRNVAKALPEEGADPRSRELAASRRKAGMVKGRPDSFLVDIERFMLWSEPPFTLFSRFKR